MPDLAALLAAFRVRCPEFHKVDNTAVEFFLAESASECSLDSYGELHQAAVLLLTARKIALSPYGQPMRLADGSTTYDSEFFRLQDIAGLGIRVI